MTDQGHTCYHEKDEEDINEHDGRCDPDFPGIGGNPEDNRQDDSCKDTHENDGCCYTEWNDGN